MSGGGKGSSRPLSPTDVDGPSVRQDVEESSLPVPDVVTEAPRLGLARLTHSPSHSTPVHPGPGPTDDYGGEG